MRSLSIYHKELQPIEKKKKVKDCIDFEKVHEIEFVNIEIINQTDLKIKFKLKDDNNYKKFKP